MSHIDRPWEGDVMKSTHRSTRHNRTLLACALASCMLLAAPQVLAQSTAATIRGQVSADSAPAGGATVTATNLATGLTRSVQSSASGSYNLAGLPPGTYRIDVTADGQTHSQNLTLADEHGRAQVGKRCVRTGSTRG